jgi:hypothetical protein
LKTLFFSNQGLGPLHLGIELEVLEQLKADANNDISIVHCNAVLNGCYFNPTKNILGCALCTSRTKSLHNKLGLPRGESLKNYHRELTLPKVNSLEELLDLTIEGINIGRGIASSLISLKRDYEINDDKFGDIINELGQTAYISFLNFKYFIELHSPDQVFFFNGRFSECHVIKELCIANNINYITLEVASKGKYMMYKNALPHSISFKNELMNKVWEQSDSQLREKNAINFYTLKRKGTYKKAINHTKNQIRNKLPKDFNPNKHNIVIFNSSEDEMKVIEEWNHNYYSSQNEAIHKICSALTHDYSIKIYLRVHPNLGAVSNRQTKELKGLNLGNLEIIPPTSDIDSYSMMEAADCVLTFGSTVGIEATFFGKPSIMFGRSFYEQLDAVYTPNTIDETIKLLQDKSLKPKPKQNTYKYAHFISTYGIPFNGFAYQDKNNASYKGIKFKKDKHYFFYPSGKISTQCQNLEEAS